MSKKRPVYVSIPVGHVCVKLDDLLQKQYYLDAREHEAAYIRHELYKVQDENENLKKQLADATKKIANLEKELNENKDRVLYWYEEHNKLQAKINSMASPVAHANAVKPDAETKET